MSDKTFYLAGPMSGIPQFNFPAFHKAAEELRGRGLTVISPAELDDPVDAAMAMANTDGNPSKAGRTWGYFLARDVRIVADKCDAIVFLPGWEKSRGARLEAHVGMLCGHSFYELKDGVLEPVFYSDIKRVICEA